MLKRHCDLCDSVIKSLETHYRLVKRTHKMFSDMENIEMEFCQECLKEILEHKKARKE